MGAKVSTEAPVDYRVEKCVKTFDMPAERIQKLWEIFCSFDKDCAGYMTVDDFFEKHLRISRRKYVDSVLDLLGNQLFVTTQVILICLCFRHQRSLAHKFR